MPEHLPGTGVPIPLDTEKVKIPADLKAAFLAVNSLYVLRAKNQADMVTRYGNNANVQPGVIITGTEQKAVWRKETSGFSTLWSDTGWKSPGRFIDPWTAAQPLQYRVIGDVCYWRGILQPPGTASEGLTKICNVPAEARPSQTSLWTISGRNSGNIGTLWMTTDGLLQCYLNVASNAYFGVPNPYPVN